MWKFEIQNIKYMYIPIVLEKAKLLKVVIYEWWNHFTSTLLGFTNFINGYRLHLI